MEISQEQLFFSLKDLYIFYHNDAKVAKLNMSS